MDDGKNLRFINYLSPGFPIEYIESIVHFIGEKLSTEVSILYESRFDGPPDGKADPFTKNQVDIGFMSSSAYLRLADKQNSSISLLPVAAIHNHIKGNGRPISFSDVIVHADDAEKFKSFDLLKGHRWAFSNEDSLSGNLAILYHLKKMGTDACFFGNLFRTSTPLSSIQKVLEREVDGAAIDSNVLWYYGHLHPERAAKLRIIDSFGPLPPYCIVVNSSMNPALKRELESLLLSMHQSKVMRWKLDEFNVDRFIPLDLELLELEREIRTSLVNCSLDTVYY